MDHAEVRELLELAAAEPGGVDGLLRGASPDAVRATDHLAGCDACRAELSELRESAASIRDVIRGTPSPDLRARTLDLVAATGRSRDDGSPARAASARRSSLRSLVPAIALGAAAAAVVAGVMVWRAVDVRLAAADAQIAEQRDALASLSLVTDWTLRLGAAPDAQLVRLEAHADGGTASGTVLISAERGELVMMATDLPAPPAGYEYRCWIDQGSGPERIGKMYRVGAVEYWGGGVDRIRGIEGPFTLGVTLASLTDTAAREPVLVGSQ
jgi:hypothetical protein